MASDIKLVANTTQRGISINYRTASGTLAQYMFLPGLNRVPKDQLKLMLKQSGMRDLLDNGNLAASKGDIDAARDVSAMVDAGQGTTSIVKPERHANQTNKGASLQGRDMLDAVDVDEGGKKKRKK